MTSEISNSLAQQFQQRLHEKQAEIISLMRALVETESPSEDESGSRAVVEVLASAAAEARCVTAIQRVDAPGFGQHLVIRAFGGQDDAGTILIVGHTDTVHPRGSVADRPWRVEGNRIHGPGIFDMKANCALAIAVLHAYDDLGIIPRCGVTLALTCDEEVGSFSGWPLLERLARGSKVQCGLVLEPPVSGGSVKTGRKGTGMFTMKVEGRAAHAGLDPRKGASAIQELARQIERLHALNDLGGGITVNVGVIQGGTRSNVVAAEAQAEIDVRFSSAGELKTIEQAVLSTKPFDERVRVTVTGGINRPPLERTPQVVELYELARNVATSMGFELREAQVGGASDGNFLAAMGIPILDGLGIDGDGAHADHEHIIVDDIARRGALLAGLIASL
ncbi:MAG: M20 family metallopeptidase [Pyrinomonadaceae bacterium]|nr:M20 family metallopeptidase [Pyrinomonadaceae bacterium]